VQYSSVINKYEMGTCVELVQHESVSEGRVVRGVSELYFL
jgi:hypothetical protein